MKELIYKDGDLEIYKTDIKVINVPWKEYPVVIGYTCINPNIFHDILPDYFFGEHYIKGYIYKHIPKDGGEPRRDQVFLAGPFRIDDEEFLGSLFLFEALLVPVEEEEETQEEGYYED